MVLFSSRMTRSTILTWAALFKMRVVDKATCKIDPTEMRKKRRHPKYIVAYETRKGYFEGVLKRLVDDVGPYVEIVRTPINNGQYIGNFALIRMIMPIIESVARAERRNEFRLLDDLGVPLPRLTWTMFRHGLAHNDNPIVVNWGKKEVSWVVSPFGHNHTIYKNRKEVHVDCTQLYEDLCSYLKTEIKRSGDKQALRRVRVRIIHPKIEEQEEFKKLN